MDININSEYFTVYKKIFDSHYFYQEPEYANSWYSDNIEFIICRKCNFSLNKIAWQNDVFNPLSCNEVFIKSLLE